MRPSDREAVRCGHLNPTPLFGPNGRQCGRSNFDRERLLSKVGVLVPGDEPGFRHRRERTHWQNVKSGFLPT